eukprot:g24144.t1
MTQSHMGALLLSLPECLLGLFQLLDAKGLAQLRRSAHIGGHGAGTALSHAARAAGLQLACCDVFEISELPPMLGREHRPVAQTSPWLHTPDTPTDTPRNLNAENKPHQLLVMKFGGTSVGGGEQLLRCAGIVRKALPDRPIVDSKGIITTLGRDGSDLTATVIGAAVKASEVQIWKDVSGVQTTDPRVISSAKPVRVLTFEEAAELSTFGSKVVHPAAVLPAWQAGVPMSVRNSMAPEDPGTRIVPKLSSTETKERRVAAISSKSNITMIVTVSLTLDEGYKHVDVPAIERELQEVAKVSVLHDVAMLTLIVPKSDSVSVLREAFTACPKDAKADMVNFLNIGVRCDAGTAFSARVMAAKRLLGLTNVILPAVQEVNEAFASAQRQANTDVFGGNYSSEDNSTGGFGWDMAQLAWARRVLLEAPPVGCFGALQPQGIWLPRRFRGRSWKMEVCLVNAENVPDGCLLSISAGGSRRQAPLAVRQKFAFSNSSTAAAVAAGGSGLKVDLLSLRGSACVGSSELLPAMQKAFGAGTNAEGAGHQIEVILPQGQDGGEEELSMKLNFNIKPSMKKEDKDLIDTSRVDSGMSTARTNEPEVPSAILQTTDLLKQSALLDRVCPSWSAFHQSLL